VGESVPKLTFPDNPSAFEELPHDDVIFDIYVRRNNDGHCADLIQTVKFVPTGGCYSMNAQA
jgi:hypothetical protein